MPHFLGYNGLMLNNGRKKDHLIIYRQIHYQIFIRLGQQKVGKFSCQLHLTFNQRGKYMISNIFPSLASIDFSILAQYATPETVREVVKIIPPALQILYWFIANNAKKQAPNTRKRRKNKK